VIIVNSPGQLYPLLEEFRVPDTFPDEKLFLSPVYFSLSGKQDILDRCQKTKTISKPNQLQDKSWQIRPAPGNMQS